MIRVVDKKTGKVTKEYERTIKIVDKDGKEIDSVSGPDIVVQDKDGKVVSEEKPVVKKKAPAKPRARTTRKKAAKSE